MKTFLPLLALLAFVGCAEEPTEVEDTTIEAPAEVVTQPEDDALLMEEDTTMMEQGDVMEADSAMADTTTTM